MSKMATKVARKQTFFQIVSLGLKYKPITYEFHQASFLISIFPSKKHLPK